MKLDYLVFTALCLSLMCGCGKKEEPPYRYHDDFYYDAYYAKRNLKICEDEYFVVFDGRYRNEVMAAFERRGFVMTRDITDCVYPVDKYFEWRDPIWQNSVCVCVKGDSSIENIPFVIYSNNLYYNESGELCGRSHLVYARFKPDQDDMGHKLSLKFLNSDEETGWRVFACTNRSPGNAVEMANWYREMGYCDQAAPELGDDPCATWWALKE